MKRNVFVFIAVSILITSVIFTSFFVMNRQRPAPARQSAVCVDIPADPDYLATGKVQDAVAALNNAHIQEHLPLLRLPANFYQLDPAQQQFIILNQERTDRGLQPLSLDTHLSLVAASYSKQMRDLQFFSHTSPIAGSFEQRVNSNPAVANHFTLAAENLAGNPVPGVGSMYEYMYNDSAESCGHRHNILDPALTIVGIGWIAGSPYGSISAQEFLTPATWNPYTGTSTQGSTPRVAIVGERIITPGAVGNRALPYGAHVNIQFQARVEDTAGGARVTWFLDRFGNQPRTGLSWEADLERLAPGTHTIFVYAVNGYQNYSVAHYTFVV